MGSIAFCENPRVRCCCSFSGYRYVSGPCHRQCLCMQSHGQRCLAVLAGPLVWWSSKADRVAPFVRSTLLSPPPSSAVRTVLRLSMSLTFSLRPRGDCPTAREPRPSIRIGVSMYALHRTVCHCRLTLAYSGNHLHMFFFLLVIRRAEHQ